MDLKDIQNLIKFVAKSGASEVKLEMEDIKITIKTGTERTETTILQQLPSHIPQMAASPVTSQAPAQVISEDLAVKEAAESGKSNFTPLYRFEWSIEQKIEIIARKIYGAAEVEYSVKAKQQIKLFKKIGLQIL